MKFIFPFAPKPDNPVLLERINSASEILAAQIETADISKWPVSDYNKKYLIKYQNKLRQTLQKYAYILLWALDGTGKPPESTVLVDYGGGCGLLTFLAKQAGLGTVIYNDIFETSIADVQALAGIFNIRPDHYVCGDIDAVKNYLTVKKITCDAVVSCDVIEHIYNVPEFFKQVHSISPGRLNVVMSTHANPLNPAINASLQKKQRLVETVDREAAWGQKDRDALQSYFHIRKAMITSKFSSLSDADASYLAQATRGLQRTDIETTAAEYIRTGNKPPLPDHPTNTCDPLNGNMADRLTKPFTYRQWLKDAGFTASLMSGYYGHPKPFLRRLIARGLDSVIGILGTQGISLASYFLMLGKK